jgi:hypothetical protein
MKRVIVELNDVDAALLDRVADKAGMSGADVCRLIVSNGLVIAGVPLASAGISKELAAHRGRKFARINKEDLMGKILDECGDEGMIDASALMDAIDDDIKVGFDTENFDYEHSKQLLGTDLVGLQEWDNGLTFLGIVAGGDWENALFFIVYWDGSRLRGYVPTDGNPWNTKTMKAYGNDQDDQETDVANARKRYPEDKWEDNDEIQADIEWDKVGADIKGRLHLGDHD